jgi:hypothetical protein
MFPSRRPLHVSRLAVNLVLVLLLVGCNGSAAKDVPLLSGQDEVSATSPIPSTSVNLRVLEHDFGLLKPEQKVGHTFKVTNESSQRWTFVKFHTSCACTVTHTPARFVEPGQTVAVEVTYRPPAQNKTDRQRVGVQFAEPEAPFYQLEVRATVRQAISLFPAELVFQRVGRGQRVEQSFEIHNFSGKDVEVKAIQGTAPWLTAVFLPIEPQGEPRPRQAWRVLVYPKTDGLPSGRHQAFLEIQSSCPESLVKRLPVDLILTAPVEVIPSQMFLGNVTTGSPRKYRLLLRFTPDAIPAEESDLEITHDLGDQFQVTCNRKPAGNWEVIATLTAPAKAADTFVEGKVTIRFKKGNLPSLEIPVLAKVNKP